MASVWHLHPHCRHLSSKHGICAGVLLLLFFSLLYHYYTPIPNDFHQKWKNMYKLGMSKFVQDSTYVVSKVKGISTIDANREVRKFFYQTKTSNLPDWVTDMTFGSVPVRMYDPARNSTDVEHAALRPAILYLHGGGWVGGSIEHYHFFIQHFSLDINTVVYSVDYRLAPRYKFPAGFNDTVEALKFLMQYSKDMKIDSDRITVMGDSAGGNLAAALTLWWRDHHKELSYPPIKSQVLVYPALQAINFNTPSYQQNANSGLVLSKRSMVEYWAYYAQGSILDVGHYMLNQHCSALTAQTYSSILDVNLLPQDFVPSDYHQAVYSKTDVDLAETLRHIITDPRFAPLMANDFSGLPPTYVFTGYYDVLRDDGLWYAHHLEKAGVKVVNHHVKAGYHGLFWKHDLEDSKAIYMEALKFLREHL